MITMCKMMMKRTENTVYSDQEIRYILYTDLLKIKYTEHNRLYRGKQRQILSIEGSYS